MLWMDEILHHLELMGYHCLLVFTGESSDTMVSQVVPERISQPSTVCIYPQKRAQRFPQLDAGSISPGPDPPLRGSSGAAAYQGGIRIDGKTPISWLVFFEGVGLV